MLKHRAAVVLWSVLAKCIKKCITTMAPDRKKKRMRQSTIAIVTVYSQNLPNKCFYASQLCLSKVHTTGLELWELSSLMWFPIRHFRSKRLCIDLFYLEGWHHHESFMKTVSRTYLHVFILGLLPTKIVNWTMYLIS